MITSQEKERYLRQIAIEGFGEKGQESLSRARVLVAGAGGLGCAVCTYLAAAGVGTLHVVDRGEVSPLICVAFNEADYPRNAFN